MSCQGTKFCVIDRERARELARTKELFVVGLKLGVIVRVQLPSKLKKPRSIVLCVMGDLSGPVNVDTCNQDIGAGLGRLIIFSTFQK